MNIVVLCGGISTERDVSISSGTKACLALRECGHNAILLDVYCGDTRFDCNNIFSAEYDVNATAEYIKAFNPDIEDMKASDRTYFGPNVLDICKIADVVFMALHGADGEGGNVQAVFDLLKIKYTGCDTLGSAIAMHKDVAKVLMADSGIPVPMGICIKKGDALLSPSENGIGLPCIVKPCCGGSSIGVTIVKNEADYANALEEAFSYEDEILVETFISGREFSVGVVDGKAYPVIEIAPADGFYGYKQKYQVGGAVETCPANIPDATRDEFQKYAELGFKALHLKNYCRFDFLLSTDNEIFCLEANTLPGMTPTSLLPQEAAAIGINYGELCELLIKLALR